MNQKFNKFCLKDVSFRQRIEQTDASPEYHRLGSAGTAPNPQPHEGMMILCFFGKKIAFLAPFESLFARYLSN